MSFFFSHSLSTFSNVWIEEQKKNERALPKLLTHFAFCLCVRLLCINKTIEGMYNVHNSVINSPFNIFNGKAIKLNAKSGCEIKWATAKCIGAVKKIEMEIEEKKVFHFVKGKLNECFFLHSENEECWTFYTFIMLPKASLSSVVTIRLLFYVQIYSMEYRCVPIRFFFLSLVSRLIFVFGFYIHIHCRLGLRLCSVQFFSNKVQFRKKRPNTKMDEFKSTFFSFLLCSDSFVQWPNFSFNENFLWAETFSST